MTSLAWNPETGAAEASAFVPVVEGDGTCTLTLGTSTVSTHATAYPDASSTSCDLLTVPRSQLSPEAWQAVVYYESSTSAASSSPTTIEVP